MKKNVVDPVKLLFNYQKITTCEKASFKFSSFNVQKLVVIFHDFLYLCYDAPKRSIKIAI